MRERGPAPVWAAVLGILLAAAPPARAQQPAADTLSGRVIAADSTPIPGARVSATGPAGSVHATRTDHEGRFLLVVPGGDGRYQLRAAALGYLPFSTSVQRPPGGARIVRTLRLSARRIALDTLTATAAAVRVRSSARTPGETAEDWGSAQLEELPVSPGDFAEIASLQPGVVRLGDGELSVAGQPPSQTGATVDGAGYGGAALPAEGVRSVAVVSNSFDPARGRYSGGEIAATTVSGTNLWGGALSARLDDPAFRYGGVPGVGFEARERRLRLSGGGGGAIVRDRLFVFGALDVARSAGPGPFLNLADPAALRRLRVDPDSARRFVEVAREIGLAADAPPGTVRSEFGSALVRVDYALSESHSLTARLDGRVSRLSGVGTSPLGLSGYGSRQRSRDGGIMAQLASGWGLWANELRVYHSRGGTEAAAGLRIPAGEVRMTSETADGSLDAATLHFGSPMALPEADRAVWELSDELVHVTPGGAHRVKTGFLFQEERHAAGEAGNRYGTFVFDGLANLELGRPASFSRALPGEPASVSRRYGAWHVGDRWQLGEALGIIGGVRVEGFGYGSRPALHPVADSLAGGRSGRPSLDVVVSPRLGFTYQLPGSSNATVHGGVGHFLGTTPLPSLGTAWGHTGFGRATLLCVGSAAPRPEWAVYAEDPSRIPSTCADGTSAFAGRSPSVTLFAPGFAAPRFWRASLGLGGRLGSRSFYSLIGIVTRGSRLPSGRDQNRAYPTAFTLPAEGGRPVHAGLEDVDPGTGGIAPGASRARPELGAVREIDARGRARSGQLSAEVYGLFGSTLVALSYTFTHARDAAGGVPVPGGSAASTADDPSRLEWAPSDWERRHALQLIVSGRPTPALRISAVAQLASGLPFTPLVSGDVNGDGLPNDRAFVFDPRHAPHEEVARGLAELMESAPAPARACLRRQLGAVAGRNSCRTPWSPSLDLRAELLPGGNVNARGLRLSVTASNVTAGLDYLLHGPDDLRGWGQYPLVDPVLLTVRGFDFAARGYRYEVNSGFGKALGAGLLRIPFALILEGRVTVGADPRYQPIMRAVQAAGLDGTASRTRLRAWLAERVRNVPEAVLALDAAEPGALGLDTAQVLRLRAVADSLRPRIRMSLTALTDMLAQRGPTTAARRARIEEHSRDAVVLMEKGLQAVREILTSEQWDLLPGWLVRPARMEDLDTPKFEATLPVP